MNISYVIPVYQGEKTLIKLVHEIKKTSKKICKLYEIILVDDSSTDKSWQIIKNQASKLKNIKGIKLSRNFGQHYAISAGLKYARFDWICVMDCDLQDKPSEIPKFVKAIDSETKIILGKRIDRKDVVYKKLMSRIFYCGLSYLSGANFDSTVANFGLYHRKVITVINGMPETIRYFPTLLKWVGFKTKFVPVQHSARESGNSTYNIKKLFSLATDIILANSDKPLKAVVLIGFLIIIFSICYAVFILVKSLSGQIFVSGFTTITILIIFLTGINIFMTGILALYTGKIFQNVKQRPWFIIEEETP